MRGNVDDGAVDDGVSVTCTESDIVDIWQDLNKDQPATKHKDQPAYRKVSSPRPRPTRAQLYRPPWLPYGCHNHIGLLSRDLQPRGMSPRDKLTPTFTRQRPHAHAHTHFFFWKKKLVKKTRLANWLVSTDYKVRMLQ